jgi:hypothetical protein
MATRLSTKAFANFNGNNSQPRTPVPIFLSSFYVLTASKQQFR